MRKYSAIFLMLVIIAQWGCKREDTYWKTEWELPLFNDSLLVTDWIPAKNLKINEQGWYEINWDTSYALSLDTLLTLPDTAIALDYTLPFQVNVPAGITLLNQTQSQTDWIPEGMELKKIFINTGKIHYKINSAVDGDIQLKFEVLRASRAGEPLLIDVVLPPGPTTLEGDFDISDFVMDLSGPNGNLTNDWTNQIIIRSADQGLGADVHMNDLVQVELNFEDVTIKRALGYLGQRQWTINESMGIGAGWPQGEFHFEDLRLDWQLENRMGADLVLNLNQVQLTSGQNQICNLSHPSMNQWQYVTRAQMDALYNIYPTFLEQTWNRQNSNIVQAMGYLGGGVKIQGEMKMNPMGNVNAYHDFFIPEPFVLHASMNIPLRFNARDISVSQKIKVAVSEEMIASGKIHFKLENAYPLNMNLKAACGSEILGEGQMAAGVLEADGVGITPTFSMWTLSCTESQLEKIKQTGGVTLTWKLNTPDYPRMVGLRPEYYAIAKCIGEAEFELGLK